MMMNGKKEIWRERIPLLASFLIPLLITVMICIDHGVFPFGDRCILHIDMYHQYCPFFTEMMDKLKTGGSFFYSWNVGLGADFVSLYAYYLASPLNWLLILCPRAYVIEFMTILVVLKIALCGLTFGYYLKMHFRTSHFALSLFASAYALSAFMAAYAWNIMWIDCLVLAPLILLGLERLIGEGNPKLYYITLALSILCNYYISIMICIFLVFWFFICWAEDRKRGVRAWVDFFWYSLLAGGTGAVLILPTTIILGYSGAGEISFPESVTWYFNMIPELARHAALTEPYTGQDHWPNIYCGVFALVLFILYLFNRTISWKKKAPRVLLLAFIAVSFANNFLDFIWHGLRFPTSLPGRQSFLYILLLLAVAFEAFLHLRKNNLWHVFAAVAAMGLFLAAAYRMTDAELVDGEAFTATAVLAGCYLALAAVYLAGAAKLRSLMLTIGCFAVLAELTLNFDLTGLDTTSRTDYVEALSDYRTVLKEAAEQADMRQELFYRTEELERKTKNDGALSGYRSGTQFSSLMNLNVSHFYQNVGMEGGKNFYCAGGATPLLSAMLSIRYVLADNPMEEGPLRTLAAKSGNTYLYENRYVLPLGFVMDEAAAEAWNYSVAGDIGAQNELVRLLGSGSDLLVPVPSASVPGESEFEAEEDGYYYAVYDKTTVDSLDEETSDGRTRSFSKVSHGYTLDLGYCRRGTVVKVKNSQDLTVSLTVYRMDQAVLEQAFGELARETMQMTSFYDTRVEGTVEMSRPGRLIFSIAKEDGWTVFVDGEVTESEEFGGAFISIPLDAGAHEIKMRYVTPGFWMGAGISAACVLLFLFSLWLRSRWQYRNTAIKEL